MDIDIGNDNKGWEIKCIGAGYNAYRGAGIEVTRKKSDGEVVTGKYSYGSKNANAVVYSQGAKHWDAKSVSTVTNSFSSEAHPEPIVDKATFDLAQKKLEGNKEYAHLVCRVFGYRFHNGIFEIEPVEAKAVNLIYRYYLQGWGKVKISKELMKQGYCTRTGKLSTQIVARVLDSDFYSGGIEVKGQYQYTFNFGHDAIVSKEDFIKVQEFRKIRRKVIGK